MLLKRIEHNSMFPVPLTRLKNVLVQNGVLFKGTGKVTLIFK